MLDGVRTVELTENYRSSPQILGLANAVLTETTARPMELRPNRPDGPVPEVLECTDEEHEATTIAGRIRDAKATGGRWRDFAVLVRTNAQLAVLAERLGAANIPVATRGGARLLDQPEVRDALRAFTAKGGPLTVQLADLERSLDPEQAGRGAPHLTAERAANVAELVRLGREFLSLEPEGRPDEFRQWLTSALRNDAGGADVDAVELSTFHAAKGLEWPDVHVAGLEDGLVPIRFAESDDQQAEEVRLLYVAFTRAERRLTLSWARRRSFGSRSVNRRSSPLLEPVEVALSILRDASTPASPTVSAEAIRRQRALLRSVDGGRPPRRGRSGGRTASTDLDEDQQRLVDLLKAWRRDQAKATGAPAFVIFSDATLVELVLTAPADHQELLQVNGFGPVKAQRFGPAVLEILRSDPKGEVPSARGDSAAG
ncbi:MAG: ATP-dependent DNA helicase UvrD2 [Microthrixaceae bacterium]